MKDIIIVDDHLIFREALKQMLIDSKAFNVVGNVGCGKELLVLLQKKSCDVLILDIALPDTSGLELLTILKVRYPDMKVLILSMYNEKQYGIRALKAGAMSYLTKDSSFKELSTAINKAAAGKQYISEAFGQVLAENISQPEKSQRTETLSKKEFEVSRLIGSGLKVGEIAQQLNLSIKTISTYRARVLQKLNLRSTADLIRYCIENNIV